MTQESNTSLVKVLIVDDEPDVVFLFREELARNGYFAGTASNGVEAILRILEDSWDILILDIQMPILDGLNAFRIIQKVAPDLPVIMLTGKALRQEMLDSVGMGAYTCLLKPVPLEKLMEVLHQVYP